MRTRTITLKRTNEDGSHPEFVIRSINLAEQLEIGDLIMKEANEIDDLQVVTREACDLITGLLVDWKNVLDPNGNPAPFDSDRLPQVVDENDLWQIAGAARISPAPEADQKKDSESPSESSTE